MISSSYESKIALKTSLTVDLCPVCFYIKINSMHIQNRKHFDTNSKFPLAGAVL